MQPPDALHAAPQVRLVVQLEIGYMVRVPCRLGGMHANDRSPHMAKQMASLRHQVRTGLQRPAFLELQRKEDWGTRAPEMCPGCQSPLRSSGLSAWSRAGCPKRWMLWQGCAPDLWPSACLCNVSEVYKARIWPWIQATGISRPLAAALVLALLRPKHLSHRVQRWCSIRSKAL